MTKKVLFVCTANICRSAMAEGIAYKLLPNNQSIIFSSAGIVAYPGVKAMEFAKKVMQERGIDISSHYSKPISLDLVKDNDYIFTMTLDHLEMLKLNYPKFTNKFFLLKNFSKKDKNIIDPLGICIDSYRKCADELEKNIRIVLDKMITNKNADK